jgi:effector-binding domain-containing protein
VPISGIFEKVGSEEIQVYELPGGKMTKIVHNGPYEECSQNYEKLFSRSAKTGRVISGLILEVYFNHPREVQPEEILTEIYALSD